MAKDGNNVVNLRQPPAKGAGVSADIVDVAITPKSLANMSDLEQDMFLQHLRERRLRAVEILKQAAIAKRKQDSIVTLVKLEKKADQVERQLEKTTKALDQLEKYIYDLRALHLQHTDTDITQIEK